MEANPKYLTAPFGWSYTDPNPFSADGSYGHQWSAFCLLDREDDQVMTGKSGQGPFSARFGLKVSQLEAHLADFLRYEHAHGRMVILSFPQGVAVDDYVAQALACTPDASVVRPNDPAIIVHSTSQAAWASIQADGALKAASQLANPRPLSLGSNQPDPITDYLSHEPPEYHDYIMYGLMDSCGPEMIVASYQAGTFIMDENAVYQPGVRLYFDNHRLIRDGLGTRDGLHVIKTHLRLPLRPYLIAAVSVDDIDPQGEVTQWTLKAFVEKTDALVRRRIAEG